MHVTSIQEWHLLFECKIHYEMLTKLHRSPCDSETLVSPKKLLKFGSTSNNKNLRGLISNLAWLTLDLVGTHPCEAGNELSQKFALNHLKIRLGVFMGCA
uniref:Uncharacterized protein n=1 Tax=Nelumbo nucifera TaxID=4432 RepID=A0A822YZ18_NELNU|nr:TPA_asm: hypothetical protein HUJ06_008401 [Nelumbo nucifera]